MMGRWERVLHPPSPISVGKFEPLDILVDNFLEKVDDLFCSDNLKFQRANYTLQSPPTHLKKCMTLDECKKQSEHVEKKIFKKNSENIISIQ